METPIKLSTLQQDGIDRRLAIYKATQDLCQYYAERGEVALLKRAQRMRTKIGKALDTF